jgi:hypothetical protein
MVVHCPLCGEEHDTEAVEFVNIEESPEGWDLMSYICPVKLSEAKAVVRRKW